MCGDPECPSCGSYYSGRGDEYSPPEPSVANGEPYALRRYEMDADGYVRLWETLRRYPTQGAAVNEARRRASMDGPLVEYSVEDIRVGVAVFRRRGGKKLCQSEI